MNKLIWWAAECSGGLCDKLLGIIATICISKIYGKEVLVRWDDCEKNLIEVNPKYDFNRKNYTFIHFNFNNIEGIKLFRDSIVDSIFNTNSNILIWTNHNLFGEYAKTRPGIPYFEILRQSVLEMFNVLTFKVKPVLSVENAIGIHIRTVDKQIGNEIEAENQREYITQLLHRIKAHLDLRIKSTYTVFLASDCAIAYGIGETVFENMVYNKGEIVHSVKEGNEKVLRDFLGLCQCRMLYLSWHSNFSRVPAMVNLNRKMYRLDKPEIEEIDKLELVNYFSQPYWRAIK